MPKETIAVIGLGYVGLPVALAFARVFPRVIGFDIDERRVASLRDGVDWTREAERHELLNSSLEITSDPAAMAEASLFVVTVPTPVDSAHRPDLGAVLGACRTIGKVIRPGAVVVFESTVYPGVTEEICGPAIAAASGLSQSVDFKLGYSPERINPGDRTHRLETIVKIVSGEDAATLERVAAAYGAIVTVGLHRAPSIKVAEAAKVIENIQRDLNIALMNELAVLFGRLDIPTRDVLAAAGSKWNFLPFTPGLVGGHCIGVDPYYLTAKAEEIGYHPEVILAGRRINEGMGRHVALELIRLLACDGRAIKGARVGILGLTFKENVPDLRNSRVPDIIAELRRFGIEPLVHDPLGDAAQAEHECGVVLSPLDGFRDLDGLVLAVPHRAYLDALPDLFRRLRGGGVLMDVKAVANRDTLPATVTYWAL